ncbi:MAG TPA: diguanylate cyclase [Mycobacterium sp.]|nr:diguanylate cyclase [Mycobacterium sp.]HNA50887.1 diguanylate cyclase [Mycobacterium sp.]HNM11012.1 diguanylate cyclase [Mycobacterium sp.]HNP12355.1 diguanylate cyclase [Mycobacterium sp.]
MRVRSGGRRPDQYYALTSLLTARDGQAFASRVIAAVIFFLGLAPVLAIRAVAPRWAGAQYVFGAAFACCAVMALLWFRHRWPTRTESAVLVAVGTLAIAACSVVPANPLFGVLGAMTFSLITGYTAMFHTLRLLALTSTVVAATTAYLAVRVAAQSVGLALAVVILITLVNVFAAFTARLVVLLSGSQDGAGAVEPLTGLLNREAFYDQTATLLASRSREDDRYLVIVVVNIDSFAAMVSMVGAKGGARAKLAAGRALRETVRRDAVVGHIGEAEYVIADSFTTSDASPLVERVRGAIAAAPAGMTASIGVVSTPLSPLVARPPQDLLDKIVGIATEAMREARLAGGNQARYVLDPDLQLTDEPDPNADPEPDWTI